MTDKKKQKNQAKEDKYKKLLDQIDLKLDGGEAKNEKGLGEISNEFTISSLLAKIEGNTEQDNVQALKKQLEDLDKRSTLLLEPESQTKQEKTERKANYKIVKDDVAKWIPVIKRAREADHLDFTHKNEADNLRVNAISGNELKKNKIAKNIEEKLAEMNMTSEKAIRAKEIELLEKLDPQEAKKKMNELYKRNVLLFQQEIKNKRLSKIKSKLYHKIKKRQKQRAEAKEFENMDEDMKLREQEKLVEERAIERIGMKHKTKSKHIQGMLKYGDKKTYQQSLNDVNHQRQALLKKVQGLENDIDSDDLDEGKNEKEIKEDYIRKLQKELQEDQQDDQANQDDLTGIKFIDDLQNSKKNSSREEARKLLSQLQEADKIDDLVLSEDDFIKSDDEEGQKKKQQKINEKKKATEKSKEDQEQFEGRKVYKRAEEDKKPSELELEMEQLKKSRNKKLNAIDIVKSHIKQQKDVMEEEEERKDQSSLELPASLGEKDSNLENKLTDIASKIKATTIQEENLTEGLNVGKLKEKFKKNAQTEFSKKDLEAFNIENREEIYKDLNNFNILVDDENEENFLAEKYEDYEKALPQDKKPLQGWGTWFGKGIEAKNLPTAEELAKQKVAKIQLLKKQRADGTLDNVILNENRNKLFTQHLVKQLPHQYKNKEQFEYVNNASIGSEWNTMRSHMNTIRPKIKTQAGQIIQPATAPKSFKQQP